MLMSAIFHIIWYSLVHSVWTISLFIFSKILLQIALQIASNCFKILLQIFIQIARYCYLKYEKCFFWLSNKKRKWLFFFNFTSKCFLNHNSEPYQPYHFLKEENEIFQNCIKGIPNDLEFCWHQNKAGRFYLKIRLPRMLSRYYCISIFTINFLSICILLV